MNPIDFIHKLQFSDLPEPVIAQAKTCALDLYAVAAAGSHTPLADIIQDYVSKEMSGSSPMLWSEKTASLTGSALANGMTIDSYDAHDGHVLCKGHVGAGIFPALIAFIGDPRDITPQSKEAHNFITALVLGYEIGSRAGIALHQTSSQYHTSGAWNAIAAAAIGARVKNLTNEQTRHALGIAEYHGPRSEMMRCIDYPTMLKDGSGIGAMTGVSATLLAELGFTGAPATTIESNTVATLFEDLGSRWYILEQYFKIDPVCRWAQPAIEAARHLKRAHQLTTHDIEKITQIDIVSFHQAIRLDKKVPQTTEEAQYSLAFSTVCALLYDTISPDMVIYHFNSPKIVALIEKITLQEDDDYNQKFPQERWAHMRLTFSDGKHIESPPTRTQGDYDTPYSKDQLNDKARQLLQTRLSSEATLQCISHFENLA